MKKGHRRPIQYNEDVLIGRFSFNAKEMEDEMKNIMLLGSMVILLFVFLIVGTGFAFEVGEQNVEITVSDAYAFRYIWRGMDLFANNDGAQQPSVDVLMPELFAGIDVNFNVWASIPVNKGHENAEEIDYTFSLSKDVLDDKLNVLFIMTFPIMQALLMSRSPA